MHFHQIIRRALDARMENRYNITAYARTPRLHARPGWIFMKREKTYGEETRARDRAAAHRRVPGPVPGARHRI